MAAKKVVIDTDVCVSAGQNSVHPVGASCRRMLKVILETGQVVAIGEGQSTEWKKICSKEFIGWRAAMQSKGALRYLCHCEDKELRTAIKGTPTKQMDPSEIQAVLKDVFLIESALMVDRIIISKDEKFRNRVKRLSSTIKNFSNYSWLNPCVNMSDCESFLSSAATYDANLDLLK